MEVAADENQDQSGEYGDEWDAGSEIGQADRNPRHAKEHDRRAGEYADPHASQTVRMLSFACRIEAILITMGVRIKEAKPAALDFFAECH